MRYLSLCCIVRDETPFLREFVEYHAVVGVEHFYFYDHQSREPVADTLADHVRNGLVTVRECGPEWTQLRAYADCLSRCGRFTRWMAFIDADEILVPKSDDDLRVILTDYEDFGALAVSWVMFGSSGHLGRPPEGQIENYTQRFSLDSVVNRHIKSIVQPRFSAKPLSTHNFLHTSEHYAVNEDRFPVSGPFSYHTVERIQCNHYYFRSQQDFCEKRERGEMNVDDSGKLPDKYNLDHFFNQAAEPVEDDRSALRFMEMVHRFREQNDPRLFKEVPANALEGTLDDFFRKTLKQVDTGKHREALQTLGFACVRHGRDPVLWQVRARLLRKVGRLEEALEAAKRSIRIRSTPEAFHELIQIQIASGMEKDAHKSLIYFQNRLKTDWAYYTAK